MQAVKNMITSVTSALTRRSARKPPVTRRSARKPAATRRFVSRPRFQLRHVEIEKFGPKGQWSYYAVLDGQNDNAVAELVKGKLHKYVEAEFKKQNAFSDATKVETAFGAAFDRIIFDLIDFDLTRPFEDFEVSEYPAIEGTTATVAVLNKSENILHVANFGGARTRAYQRSFAVPVPKKRIAIVPKNPRVTTV